MSCLQSQVQLKCYIKEYVQAEVSAMEPEHLHCCWFIKAGRTWLCFRVAKCVQQHKTNPPFCLACLAFNAGLCGGASKLNFNEINLFTATSQHKD